MNSRMRNFIRALQGVVNRLYLSCDFSALKNSIQMELNSLLDSSASFHSWGNPDLVGSMSRNPLSGFERLYKDLEKKFGYCQSSRQIAESECPFLMLKENTPVSLTNFTETIDYSINNNPKGKEDSKCANCMKSVLIDLSGQKESSVISFHRLIPQNKPFSEQDLQVLEFLWPVLLNAIQTMVLKETFINLHSILKTLINSQNPFAILNDNLEVEYSNKAFESFFHLKSDRLIPAAISNLIQRKANELIGSSTLETALIEIPCFTNDYGLQELVFQPIEFNDKGCPNRWVLISKTAKETGFKIDPEFHNLGLTSREQKICQLLSSGVKPKEIADQLFISYHTVRNHLQNIHKKLGVTSRSQLLALFSH